MTTTVPSSGGVSFWRDITTRAQLVEELGQQRRLLDLAHDAIIVREPARSAVTYWNREAEELYGYSAERSARGGHPLAAADGVSHLDGGG